MRIWLKTPGWSVCLTRTAHTEPVINKEAKTLMLFLLYILLMFQEVREQGAWGPYVVVRSLLAFAALAQSLTISLALTLTLVISLPLTISLALGFHQPFRSRLTDVNRAPNRPSSAWNEPGIAVNA